MTQQQPVLLLLVARNRDDLDGRSANFPSLANKRHLRGFGYYESRLFSPPLLAPTRFAGAYQAPFRRGRRIYDRARGERLEKGMRRSLKGEIKEALKGGSWRIPWLFERAWILVLWNLFWD